MKIIAATAFPGLLSTAFANSNDWVYFCNASQAPITVEFIQTQQVDLLVSFGYPKIFPAEILEQVRVVNLHCSLLPWNRGPNPNIWSWLDDTPKGVTIHEVDAGVDSGPVIVSKTLAMDINEETLNSSFSKLLMGAAEMFSENWQMIRSGEYQVLPQQGQGSKHCYADQAPFAHIIQKGLDWPLPQLLQEIRTFRQSQGADSKVS